MIFTLQIACLDEYEHEINIFKRNQVLRYAYSYNWAQQFFLKKKDRILHGFKNCFTTYKAAKRYIEH